jgi:hypothetical protein
LRKSTISLSQHERVKTTSIAMSAEAEKPAPNTNLRQHGSWKRSSRDHVVQALLWFCFVGTLLLIFGPALLSHMQRAADH